MEASSEVTSSRLERAQGDGLEVEAMRDGGLSLGTRGQRMTQHWLQGEARGDLEGKV